MTQLGRWKNLPPSCFFVISLDSYSAPAGFLWRGVPLYHAQTAPEVPPEGVFNPKNAAIPHKARSINGYCTHTNERRMELLPPCVVFCIISRNWQKRRKKILQGCKKRKISLRKTSSAASEGRKWQEIYGFVQNGKSHWPKSASKEKKPLQNRDWLGSLHKKRSVLTNWKSLSACFGTFFAA